MIFSKKNIAIGLSLLVAIFIVGAPLVSHADPISPTSAGATAAGGNAETRNSSAGISASAKSGSTGGTPTQTFQQEEDSLKEVGGVAGLIAWVAGGLLSLAAWGIEVAINLGNQVLNLGVVQKGWDIVLNFTNLGFVLAIIVIAFATIFRIESYALKQTLWKLIVAAILVNFSLFIAGTFISGSAILMNTFKDAISQKELSAALGRAIQPQSFGLQAKEPGAFRNALEFLEDPIGYVTSWAASIIFVVIFTLLAALVFFSLFLMLLIRILALTFLLIISPIIWLCWIFPGTKQYWDKWWKEFIRWNLFGPAVMFFIYLTVVAMAATGVGGTPVDDKDVIVKATALSNSAAQGFDKGSLLTSNFGQNVMRLLIALGLLIGGMLVANSFGIAGGGLALKGAKGVGKGFGRWAGRKGTRLGTLPLRKWPLSKAANRLQKVGSTWGSKPGWKGRLGRVGTWAMTPVRGLGNVGKNLALAPSKYAREAEKEFDGMESHEAARRWHNLDMQGKIGLLQSLRKKRDVELLTEESNVTPEEIQEVIDQMGKHQMRKKDITEVVPVLATQKIDRYDRDSSGVIKRDASGNPLFARNAKGEVEKDEINIYQTLQKAQQLRTTGKHAEADIEEENAERALGTFISEMGPGKFSAAQWRDIFMGRFKGKMSDKDWDDHGSPMVIKSLIRGSTAESMVTLYRSFKKGERDKLHRPLLDAIDAEVARLHITGSGPTPRANARLQVLWGADSLGGAPNGSQLKNIGLAKFFENSDTAKDLGIDLNEP